MTITSRSKNLEKHDLAQIEKAQKTIKKFDLNGKSLSIHSNPELTTLTEESGVHGLSGCNSEAP